MDPQTAALGWLRRIRSTPELTDTALLPLTTAAGLLQPSWPQAAKADRQEHFSANRGE